MESDRIWRKELVWEAYSELGKAAHELCRRPPVFEGRPPMFWLTPWMVWPRYDKRLGTIWQEAVEDGQYWYDLVYGFLKELSDEIRARRPFINRVLDDLRFGLVKLVGDWLASGPDDSDDLVRKPVIFGFRPWDGAEVADAVVKHLDHLGMLRSIRAMQAAAAWARAVAEGRHEDAERIAERYANVPFDRIPVEAASAWEAAKILDEEAARLRQMREVKP